MSELDDSEKAAARAYLQRSEVRLSTVHRVATALLSGAGLMVLLPAVGRDSVVGVVRPLVSGDLDAAHLLLAASVALALLLPIVALWLLLRDLTRFYFHANHLRRGAGIEHAEKPTDVFTPRFTLTGLRLPSDELGDAGAAALAEARHEPTTIELLVPRNDAMRTRIDRQLAAYGRLPGDAPHDAAGDEQRAAGLFELVASRERSLVEEVAKVEHGMARHILRLQVIVLRYVKALLALLTTALAVFSLAAVTEGRSAISASDDLWMACILLIWAPIVIVAVGSPVRWLDRMLRSEGAVDSAVADDPELTQVERIGVRIALAGYVLAMVALVASIADDSVTSDGQRAAVACAAATVIGVTVVLTRWGGRRSIAWIVGRTNGV